MQRGFRDGESKVTSRGSRISSRPQGILFHKRLDIFRWLLTSELMNGWVSEFNSWDVCDRFCLNLFYKSPLAYHKIVEWNASEKEFVERAALVLIAVMARRDKKRMTAPLPISFLS
ncbi:MAG: DNA alkylation repair protein [Dehalococcoidia bacterium]|nr:DNA alkylation repair protein [Dehalococcoidia bacterium]